MGFGTSPGHRNATYDADTDGQVDVVQDGTSFLNPQYDTGQTGEVDVVQDGTSFTNPKYDTDEDGNVENLDPDAAQEQALAVDFVVGSL